MRLRRDIREAILQRDEACAYCGDSLGPFEVDHVVPRWRNGTDEPTNLVLACRRCNQAKARKNVVRFLEEMEEVRKGRKRISHGGRIVKVRP